MVFQQKGIYYKVQTKGALNEDTKARTKNTLEGAKKMSSPGESKWNATRSRGGKTTLTQTLEPEILSAMRNLADVTWHDRTRRTDKRKSEHERDVKLNRLVGSWQLLTEKVPYRCYLSFKMYDVSDVLPLERQIFLPFHGRQKWGWKDSNAMRPETVLVPNDTLMVAFHFGFQGGSSSCE